MSILDELLTKVGTPGLMLGFAVLVWTRLEQSRQDIRDLWSLVNGKGGHSEQIARLETESEGRNR
jgi:hypothetical protein